MMDVPVKYADWLLVKHADERTSQVTAWLWVRHVDAGRTSQVTDWLWVKHVDKRTSQVIDWLWVKYVVGQVIAWLWLMNVPVKLLVGYG